MKTAVIIHGYNDQTEYQDVSRPAASNDHWLPWIQRQLLLKGIEAQTPEMPGFYIPTYEAWKEMFERFTPNEDTVLIGHSCGGGFLVRWLSETNMKVGKVVLVAPWIDPEKKMLPDFFAFTIDPKLVDKTAGVTIMYAPDDDTDILTTVETLTATIAGVQVKQFEGKGHFVLSSMHTDAFPELLEEVLG
ncbi:MAG: hypothetical protein RL150_131 [Candidatus Parcubacteria bacterium]|jgi:predicted alpha/beta hydrolase family esterase